MYKKLILDKLVSYFCDLGCVKRVISKTRNDEFESTLEHTALAVFLIRRYDAFIPETLDRLKLIDMALAHDIPEAIAGDCYVYGDKTEQKLKEAEAASVIFEDYSDWGCVWKDYENRNTAYAYVVKCFDILSAITMITLTGGKIWKERKVTYEKELGHLLAMVPSDIGARSIAEKLLLKAKEEGLFYEPTEG